MIYLFSANGSPRKKKGKNKFSDESDISNISSDVDSDVEFSSVKSPVVKERVLNRRAATKVIKYDISDDDDENEEKDEEPVLYENEAILEKSNHQALLSSDDEEDKPAPVHETSEDMFDTLVGRKKEPAPEKPPSPTHKRKKLYDPQSDSDDLFTDKKNISIASDDEFEAEKPPTKKTKKVKEDKPKKPRQKKKKSSDGEDTPPKKTKTKKKKAVTSGDDSDEFVPTKDESDNDDHPTEIRKPAARPGRGAAAKSKYTFDNSSDEDF